MNIDQPVKSRFNRLWLLLFLLDAIADLTAIQLGCEQMRYVTKPLLMLLLLLWFNGYPLEDKKGRRLIQLALLFSCGGDTLLLFASKSELYFIGGLISFLIAHIFYILFFLKVKKQNKPGRPWNPVLVFLVMVYIGLFFYLLREGAGPLEIPVLLYAAVIGTMLLAAVNAFHFPRQLSGALCVTGALLFVISDSVLGFDKFYHSFSAAGMFIMSTYCLAQLLLVTGSRKYLQSRNNP
ncbi:lysoplasmalogenase [Pseudoflavitalea sp. G-6-1-2]|uniref:lysoplasmalogenase n=1 Tax=Pseudoflavitalea sp. G-6-1-2 TaxID=2728841 RepID=UPI00146AF14C|nr:lysoplasmalogenase [Pseudoflavitalea sp. G-6-1-2]NML19698.1 lysoplasmalogenase [Pseudoflavitalea sp. G-6-1-2]